MRKIKGLRTGQIAAALGHCPYDEVIHRDNMVDHRGKAGRMSKCPLDSVRKYIILMSGRGAEFFALRQRD